MGRYISIVLAVLISLGCFAKNTKSAKKDKKHAEPQVELATKIDTASYALGVAIGAQMLEELEKDNYNKGIYAKAFCDVIFSNPTLMTSDSANRYMRQYVKELQNAAIEAAKAEEKKFLEENKKREGVIETASGLQYQVVKMGEGPKPTADSKVKVHYTGSLLNGKKFDSSYDRGEPTSFRLSGVIKGWTEGLQLMPVGSKFTFYIPAELGYGAREVGGVIPPYSTLIFEVELIEIINN